MRARIALAALGIALYGCPRSEKSQRNGPEPCARFGQTCEVSPGKLGTCVIKDGCSEATAACFVCQSQH
jgi:hypothetical protein